LTDGVARAYSGPEFQDEGGLYMMSIHAEEIGPVTIMYFQGILTRETLKELEDQWSEYFAKRPAVIAFDFRDLGQVDSISINHIFKMSRAAKDKNVKLVIFNINEPLFKIFEVIKLDRVVTIMTKSKFENEYLKSP
jgi:anti-anti-sigma factor